MSELWFRLDNPASDGAEALSFTRQRLEEAAEGDVAAWRWIVLGAHLALQDFILASFPNNLYAMRPSQADRFIQGMHDGANASELPDLRTDWFPRLYERMKEATEYEPEDEVDRRIVDSDSQDQEARTSLHSIRNGLVHHFPGGWSIEVALLSLCVRAALIVIEHLGWQQQYTNHVFWPDEDAREAARAELDACRGLMDGMAT